MNKKGQASFEALIITVVIFAVSMFVLMSYLNLNDSTMALAMLKTETLQKLNALDKFYFLEKIDFQENSVTNEIQLFLTTKPNDLTYLNLTEIKQKIIDSTKYETVNINLNGTAI